MKRLVCSLASIFLLFCLSSCDDSGSSRSCTDRSDCNPGEICLDGECQPAGTDGDADSDADGDSDGDADGDSDADAETCPPDREVCEGICCGEDDRCLDGRCCPEADQCSGHCCEADETCMGGHCHLTCEGGHRCLSGEGTEVCCSTDEVCFMNGCVTPSGDCASDADCDLDEYCEETVGQCLSIPTSECEYYPPVGDFSPIVEWRWPPEEGSATLPHHVDVLAPPVVGDMDGDGIPEVAFVAYRDSCDGGNYWTGVLTILRGDTGEEVLRLDDPDRRLGSSTALTLGDIDMDGLPEVVVMRDTHSLLAYEMDGTLLWESDTVSPIAYGGISMADLDADGDPEIFVGTTIWDHNGLFICTGTGGGIGGRPNRAISTAADLDGDPDGDLEIVAGNAAYHHDCSLYWQAEVADGYPGVADLFDATGVAGTDGVPEVISISSGSLYVLNGQDGTTVWGPHAISGTGFGGAPNIADFDNDGFAEIGTAGGDFMVVFDPDGPEPILWQQPTKDTSSAITGSTVFDFEGDGEAEIVYTDECFVRIYKGSNGDVLFEEPNNTRTHNEYPIIVDLDADGNSELVVTANICVWDCESLPGWTGPARRGITIYGDAELNWVRTREIWNQHAYHVTNINDDGTIPTPEPHNWSEPGLNNFRQNVQTWGVHNAPNMTGDLFGGDDRACGPGGTITLGLMVVNEGSRGVDAGVPVGFYRVLDSGERVFVGETATAAPLLPGMSEYVELLWNVPDEDPFPTAFHFVAIVDDPELGEVAVHECIEDDNEIGPTEVLCDIIG